MVLAGLNLAILLSLSVMDLPTHFSIPSNPERPGLVNVLKGRAKVRFSGTRADLEWTNCFCPFYLGQYNLPAFKPLLITLGTHQDLKYP